MLNFRPITEPFIKLCGDMAEEIKQLKYENAELKEMLENTRHDLFYTREQNRFLSESLADLQREKRKDLEKRVADLEEQLEKKVFLLDDNCKPIKSFTLTGKLTFMDEPAEEKLEVGKWYDASLYTIEELKELLPVGTTVLVTREEDNDREVDLEEEYTQEATVKRADKRLFTDDTRIAINECCFYRRYFKIIE